MNNIYGIKFKNDGKVYYFEAVDFTCSINVTVIVETEKGEQFGKVVSEIDKENLPKSLGELKKIIRISTKADYNNYLNNLKDATEALSFAKEQANDLELKMNFIDAVFTFDRKQLLLNFLADQRIDFRELAKRLAAKYRTRIELRQIGARDKAKEVSGLGICGRPLCCSTFLRHIDSISMNSAKNQNIALNPSKINGACGRLLCCLTYEDENYSECRKGLPYVGQEFSSPLGKGRVVFVDILNRKYKININNEIKEIELKDSEDSKE